MRLAVECIVAYSSLWCIMELNECTQSLLWFRTSLQMAVLSNGAIFKGIELQRLTSRNLHSDILAGNQESARAAVALVLTDVEQ